MSGGRIENLTPWKPGQSGNPGGRPRKQLLDELLEDLLTSNHSELARELAGALIARARKGDIRAIQLIAERTQGKPTQGIGIAADIGSNTTLLERLQRAREHVEMSDAELQERIDTLTAELRLKPIDEQG